MTDFQEQVTGEHHHHKPSLWQRLGKAETYLDNLALILILVLGIAVAVGMFVAQGDMF